MLKRRLPGFLETQLGKVMCPAKMINYHNGEKLLASIDVQGLYPKHPELFYQPPWDLKSGPTPVMGTVRRWDLLRCLATGLPAESVRYGCEVVALGSKEGKIAVEMSNGSFELADLVVGADGTHSTIRKIIEPLVVADKKISSAPKSSRYGLSSDHPTLTTHFSGFNAFYAFTKVDRYPQCLDTNVFWGLDPNALCWTYPVGQSDELVMHFAYRSDTPGPLAVEKCSIDKFRSVTDFPRNPAFLKEAFAAATQVKHLGIYEMERLVPGWSYQLSDGQVVLLGDSCHAFTPFLHQGANQAIIDGLCLASCLSKQSDLKSGVQLYEEVRKPTVANLVDSSHILGSVETSTGNVRSFLRDAMARFESGMMTEIYLNSLQDDLSD
eukprot:TRINITY_DN20793_c0_g2_i1.p1 TRINITY_DN20793_c0_g2~~TRINITY_DN20793_c0_g2_i1.p1  ORF type:complete len:443 (-),score=38.01 TRINITY_DN20793_c0_g2_i1:200-1342(-)